MHYELTDETTEYEGRILHRIRATEDLPRIGVTKGTKGGWIETSTNLQDAAWVYGNAKVCKLSDYIVFKNWWSSGRYFTWTRSNNMWRVGCFYGTGKELVRKAKADSDISGREYARIVRYVNTMLREEKKDRRPHGKN